MTPAPISNHRLLRRAIKGLPPVHLRKSTTDLQAEIKADLVIKLWFMPKVLVAADQTLLAWGTVSITLDPQGIITAKLVMA